MPPHGSTYRFLTLPVRTSPKRHFDRFSRSAMLTHKQTTLATTSVGLDQNLALCACGDAAYAKMANERAGLTRFAPMAAKRYAPTRFGHFRVAIWSCL